MNKKKFLQKKNVQIKLYSSAPLESVTEVGERFWKNIKDMNNSDDFTNNLKETITYFKDENEKPQTEIKKS